MPKQRWTTGEQRIWLEERIPAFLEAQQADTLANVFFPDLYDEWPKLYPTQPPTAEELEKAGGNLEKANKQGKKKMENVSFQYIIIKRCGHLLIYIQKRLAQWFHNITCAQSAGGKRGVIKIKKTTRLVPAWQTYINLYYDEKLKPLVEKAYADHLASLEEGKSPKPKVVIIGEVAQAMLEDESDEIKDEIENHRQKVKNEPDDDITTSKRLGSLQQ